MTEAIINIRRSSIFENYQSDVDTNSDTINDFSQYSDDGIIKTNREEIRDLTPEPQIKNSVPIVVDNISHKITNEIQDSDNDSIDIDDDDEDNPLFEITKKTTIRKIISRTTSINGVEKENEVKEFLIKDSQINDSLLDSKKRDENGAFISSRRGSHASVRRKSLAEKVNKDKVKNEKVSKDANLFDSFKSDLEKINDESEEKDILKHSNQGLSWTSPHDLADIDDESEFRFSQNDTNANERCNIPISFDNKRIPVSHRIDDTTESHKKLFEEEADKNFPENLKIKITYDDLKSVPQDVQDSTHGNRIFDQSNKNSDVDEKCDIINKFGDKKPARNFENGFLAEDVDVDENCDFNIWRDKSKEITSSNDRDFPKGKLDEDLDIEEKCYVKIKYGDHKPSLRDTGYSSPSRENSLGIDFVDQSPIIQVRDSRNRNKCHKSVPEKENTSNKYVSNTDGMRWIDPMKSNHLKYDSTKDNSIRRKLSEGRRSSLDNLQSKSNNPTTTAYDNKKTSTNTKSKEPLINDIREYIIRGNIRENLFQIRHPNTAQPKSATSGRMSPKRSDTQSKTLSRESAHEKYKSTSFNSRNQTKEPSKIALSEMWESFRPSRQSSQIAAQNSTLKRYDSLDSISINNTNASGLSRHDGIHSQVSKIFNKVDNLGKRLSESSQLVPHYCPDNTTNICGYCCHSHGCYGHVCVDRIARLNSIARHNLANCGRNFNVSMETLPKRNGETSMNANKTKEYSITSQDYKQSSILEIRIHNLEKRLHSLQKDLKEFKSVEQTIAMEPENNVKNQCRNIERQLQLLYESIHQIRGLS